MKPTRKRGRKIEYNDPRRIYERNRIRHYLHYKAGKIDFEEFERLMDENLEDYKKNKNDKV